MKGLAWLALTLMIAGGCGSDGGEKAADGGADQGIADQGIADQSTLPMDPWAFSAGSPQSDYALAMAVDGQGNSTVTGACTAPITLGTTALTAGAFVIRLDRAGKVVWAVSHGGQGASDVALDSAGNSYLTGLFDGTMTIGSTTLSGTADLFVAKLDKDGKVLWAVSGGGPDSIEGHGIAVDGQGNCYVTGYFFGSAKLGSTTLSGDAAFVAKLDKNGTFLWAKAASGAMAYDIAVDSTGNSYVTGGYRGTATFGAHSLSIPSTLENTFVAKLDQDGTFLWATGGGSSAGNGIKERGQGIALDGSGNSYVTGLCAVPATFGSATIPDSGLGHAGYAAKLDAGGSFAWAVVQPVGAGIAVDSAGSSYVTSEGMLAVKLDPGGTVQWSVPGPTSGIVHPVAIGVDERGYSHVAGMFMGTVSVGSLTLTSSGKQDLFVIRLPPSGAP